MSTYNSGDVILLSTGDKLSNYNSLYFIIDIVGNIINMCKLNKKYMPEIFDNTGNYIITSMGIECDLITKTNLTFKVDKNKINKNENY